MLLLARIHGWAWQWNRVPTWRNMARRNWDCSADVRLDAMDIDYEREQRWLESRKPLPVKHSFDWTELPSLLKDLKIPSWVEDIKKEPTMKGR